MFVQFSCHRLFLQSIRKNARPGILTYLRKTKQEKQNRLINLCFLSISAPLMNCSPGRGSAAHTLHIMGVQQFMGLVAEGLAQKLGIELLNIGIFM